MWQADTVSANGIQLHYYRTGGDKPQIVLSHGFSDNALCWTPIAQALAADYDVVLYDARGHGQSSGPETGFGDEQQADDLGGLICALGLERPMVIGHSMGARTAAIAAGRHPQLIRAVILEDPPWFANWSTPADVTAFLEYRKNNPSPEENRFKAWLLELNTLSHDELEAQCHADSPDWPEGEFAAWAASKHEFNMQIFDVIDRDQHLSQLWPDTAAAITCPALLITGDVERGALITPELAAEFVSRVPQGRHVHIADSTHNIRRNQHERYMAVVRDFLNEIYAS